MKKVVFIGAKQIGYECFKVLVSKRTQLNYTVAGLLTNLRFKRNAASYDLTELANSNNITIFDNLDSLIKLDYDILISVQYHEILKSQHIQSAKEIAVNLHMAPLPEYRGCNQFSFAIIEGAKEFGTTIHKMTTGIDSGDIIFERRFRIKDNVFVEELYEQTREESLKLFKENLSDLITGNYTLTPQAMYNNRKKGFHLRSEINEIKKIDLSWNREKIERHIRATLMPGFEGPYTMIGNKRIKFELG